MGLESIDQVICRVRSMNTRINQHILKEWSIQIIYEIWIRILLVFDIYHFSKTNIQRLVYEIVLIREFIKTIQISWFIDFVIKWKYIFPCYWWKWW